ncbi:2-haloalkanoic acid dehalogenase [Vibrio ponticus]|uniref:2-haloalkanoic acid dehalogenase n=1 Tax=Vibrio ponticus TaxID=265668 RepID=A0A3N3DWC3_9VIBR|nr:5-amino-6-(5-phospho-D-ribitylamino)uracil phosphatase YigB [Vibrio ponticus]OLQ93681.1 2-haloalkanoic acid dehalogenase [Vibrio ponticus]ROV58682.1 5-amino-6-(5-phospho-D-ribitylamino)uracil phosphatase YigB [Vibrio ponticus]
MKYYRQLKPIKAMSFDLDDTLYDNRPVIARLTREANAWFFHHHPIAATRDEAWWLKLKLDLAKQDNWLYSDLTLWRHRTTTTGLTELGYSAAQAEQAADDLLQVVTELRSDFVVPKTTHQVMAQLAEKYPLVAITNGNVDVERIGLADYFSLILQAGRNGHAKPHGDMFRQTQQFLTLDSESILHVGDHLKTDVFGAKQNGFQACWYNDQGTCLREAKHTRVLPDVEIHQLDSLLLL